VGRLYYGWCIVGVAMMAYMLIIGTTFSAFGLFVLPVSAEFKLTRAEMNTALILLNLGNAAMAPLLGRLLDRIPARRVYFACAVLLAVGFVVLGLSRSIWLSGLVLGVLMPLGVLGAGTLTMTVFLARWFTAHRGRALTIASVGLNLASVTVPPVVGLLIESQGWRTALLIVGVAVGVLLGGLGLLLRERPGLGEHEAGGEPAREAASPDQGAAPVSPAAILRMPQFWSLGLSVAAAIAVIQTFMITLVPLGRENGLSLMKAASLMPALGGGALAATFFIAALADKVDRILMLAGFMIMGALVNVALPFARDYTVLMILAALMGVINAALTPLFYALLADRFGLASFGTVRGLALPLTSALGMVAVRGAGEVFDATGSYDALFHAFVILQLVAAGLMFATRFTRPVAASQAASPTAS
jgi:MFS family permease